MTISKDEAAPQAGEPEATAPEHGAEMPSAAADAPNGIPANGRSIFKRLAPVLVIIGLAVSFFALGLDEYVNLETLAAHHSTLSQFVDDHFLIAAISFVLFYAAFVAISIPGAAVITVASGFLFGTLLGGSLTIIGATAGATAIFLIARTAVGDLLKRYAEGMMAKMAEGFRKDAFNYLLALRLMPVFPFFVVNVAPAFLGVRLPTFVLATFLGIAPATFVFASVGAGLGSVIARGDEISLENVMTPQIITALVGIAMLALIPVGVKRWRSWRATRRDAA